MLGNNHFALYCNIICSRLDFDLMAMPVAFGTLLLNSMSRTGIDQVSSDLTILLCPYHYFVIG